MVSPPIHGDIVKIDSGNLAWVLHLVMVWILVFNRKISLGELIIYQKVKDGLLILCQKVKDGYACIYIYTYICCGYGFNLRPKKLVY